MSCIAEFTVPPDAFPFGLTLLDNPDVRIEIDRIVPTDESALPFFWVWGSDPEGFLAAAEDEPGILETVLLEEVEDGGLFRAEWAPNAAIVKGFEQLDVTIVESEGTVEHWRFEVRTQDRSQFTHFQDVFDEQGIPISLTRINDLEETVDSDSPLVTPEQRETLVRAYREGYYESPRQVTQAELGASFDCSHRAISDRLRRGTRNLIASTLLSNSNGTT